MKAVDILHRAVEANASDIFLVPGTSYALKVSGQIRRQGEGSLVGEELAHIIEEIYEMAGGRSMAKLHSTGDDDFSFSVPALARFRASVFRQRGSIGAVIRVVHFELPDAGELGIPAEVLRLSDLKSGLALVTGSAGSGKSTTLACIIDQINNHRNAHVITLEDPIEYLHRHKKSIVTQREILTDSEDYGAALRAALRQAPDVILLGELRDYETIRTAMTAAETGHLVISTLHTTGAANTIDRIVDVFPQNQQNQIRIQLSMVLEVVVSQQLVPAVDGRVVPAFELMVANSAIRNMIRDSKTHQINSVLLSGRSEGMMLMDQSLMKLTLDGVITRETALNYAMNKEQLERRFTIEGKGGA